MNYKVNHKYYDLLALSCIYYVALNIVLCLIQHMAWKVHALLIHYIIVYAWLKITYTLPKLAVELFICFL